MRTRSFTITVGGLMIVIAVVALLLATFLPKGPRDAQEAIRVALSYAKQERPDYPFEQYEAHASWYEARRVWEVTFVANRPLIHTLVEINYDTGICKIVPVHYSFN